MRNYFYPVLFLLLFISLPVAYAGSDHVVANYEIISEYQSPVPGRAVNEVRWQFAGRVTADGYMIEIEDLDQVVGCRAELYFSSNQVLEQADCFRWVKGAEVCSANQYDTKKPALLNASIIPGDWLNRPLPFVYQANKRKVVLYEQIGTSRFANYLIIQDRQISWQEALAQGMIRDDLQAGLAGADQFYLVEVSRAGNGAKPDLLLQQLWLAGDNFWLYESKAGRRSWRLLQK
jgi:hypothetical protein